MKRAILAILICLITASIVQSAINGEFEDSDALLQSTRTVRNESGPLLAGLIVIGGIGCLLIMAGVITLFLQTYSWSIALFLAGFVTVAITTHLYMRNGGKVLTYAW